MSANDFETLLGIVDEHEYESVQSSDDELPDPAEIGPVTYDSERMYIIATLRYLVQKVKQLTSDYDELLRSK